jgi:hypothetical protein
MKKGVLLLIISASLILVFAVFFLLRPKNYKLIDINADNYEEMLKINNKSIYSSGIDNCIPDKISILKRRKR